MVSHFWMLGSSLSGVSPVFWTQKMCPFSLDGGVPSRWKIQRLCEHFSRTKFCVPWIELSQRRGSTVLWVALYIKGIMHQVVACKRLKTMENYRTVIPKRGCSRLRKVVVYERFNYGTLTRNILERRLLFGSGRLREVVHIEPLRFRWQKGSLTLYLFLCLHNCSNEKLC